MKRKPVPPIATRVLSMRQFSINPIQSSSQHAKKDEIELKLK